MKILSCAAAIAWTVTSVVAQPCVARAESPPAPILFYATQSGRTTLDNGEGGGNPFASALIELLSRADLTLSNFPSELNKLTFLKSRGFQSPDVPAQPEPANWKFQPRPVGETRVALVMVFSDYSTWDSSWQHLSLAGARLDAGRVSTALSNAGFETETVVDPTRLNLPDVLRRFAARSSAADFAVLYTTGHGVEVNGVVYLIPGDFPLSQGAGALEEKAYRISQFASFARANRASLVFYGGCRDNPYGWK